MDALEFSTKIEHGTIQLPEKYSDYGNAYVRVIILVDKPEQVLTQKEKLSLTFQKMKQKNMFRQIENPTEWQKQLRDEYFKY